LNDLEVNNPSDPEIDQVEDGRRSISSMVPNAIDPKDSLRIHLLAILCCDLPGDCDDSWNDQDLICANCRRGELISPMFNTR
jgi:hypothetical protein